MKAPRVAQGDPVTAEGENAVRDLVNELAGAFQAPRTVEAAADEQEASSTSLNVSFVSIEEEDNSFPVYNSDDPPVQIATQTNAVAKAITLKINGISVRIPLNEDA